MKAVRRLALALFGAALTLASGGCGGHLQAFPTALRDWQTGRRAQAVQAAREELTRWRDGNHLSEADLAHSVEGIDTVLDDDVPIVSSHDVALAPPGESADIDRQMRADLLSNRATSVIRAIHTVESLGLVRHGPEILTVVFRREPVIADGGLLTEASPALRSVTTKRLALRALEALATPKKPVL